MDIYRQQFRILGGIDLMGTGAKPILRRMYAYAMGIIFTASAGLLTEGLAGEPPPPPPPGVTFNLIVPFKDLTVGQGQEATMDTEVVNRTKEPVEVSLTIDGIPSGWDINFNSRYPSFPVRS